MSIVAQIKYHNAPPSAALDRLIQAETSKLQRFFDRIVSCRVLVEHDRRRNQPNPPFVVRIELTVPGERIVVNNSVDARAAIPSEDDELLQVRKTEHEADSHSPRIAVRDAFHKLERRLQEYARRKSGR